MSALDLIVGGVLLLAIGFRFGVGWQARRDLRFANALLARFPRPTKDTEPLRRFP